MVNTYSLSPVATHTVNLQPLFTHLKALYQPSITLCTARSSTQGGRASTRVEIRNRVAQLRQRENYRSPVSGEHKSVCMRSVNLRR